jgi:BirA family biotin operon repressor/biotin-[acetyl-CoA-carboxylase] ligase
MGVAAREKVAFAREQRREPTEGERRLWRRLRDHQLGVKFRRQHPLGDFVLDFYCAEMGLVVEVDGSAHTAQSEYDEWRDAALAGYGLHVMRFHEQQVLSRVDQVLEEICRRLACLTPQPPLRNGEGEKEASL